MARSFGRPARRFSVRQALGEIEAEFRELLEELQAIDQDLFGDIDDDPDYLAACEAEYNARPSCPLPTSP